MFSFISERIVNFADVCGRCYVIFGDNLDKSLTLSEWTAAGPYRFYFNQAYDSMNQTFTDPPSHATLIGSLGKVRSIQKPFRLLIVDKQYVQKCTIFFNGNSSIQVIKVCIYIYI